MFAGADEQHWELRREEALGIHYLGEHRRGSRKTLPECQKDLKDPEWNL